MDSITVDSAPPSANKDPTKGKESLTADVQSLKNIEQLHEEIAKREYKLKANVEATKEEIQACFRHCQQQLKDREDVLLKKLRQEHRRLKRSLLAPKRMPVNVNYNSLNGGEGGGCSGGMQTISEGDGEVIPNEDRLSDAATDQLQNGNHSSADFTKMLTAIDKALRLVDTPFHFTRADRGIIQQFDNLVESLGMVYLGDADPSRTIVNAHPGLVLAESTAKVKGVNQRGAECVSGGADICASLTDPEGNVTSCDVEDCLNGLYKIVYMPQTVGRHHLHVTISGDSIRNSPLDIEVKPVRLLPRKAIIGGSCTVAMEMPREYNLPDKNHAGKTQKISLQSLKIAIVDPEGKDVEASVLGNVQRRGSICTYTLKYIPKKPGFHEIKVTQLGQDDVPLAEVVLPVSDKEQIGRRGREKGMFDNPTDIISMDSGDLLIADTVENERVQCLSAEGQYKFDFPFPGQEPILLATDDRHIAALLLNVKHVRILTLRGQQIHEFGYEEFVQPYGIAMNSESKVFVSDRGAHCIFIFSLEGVLWRKIGRKGSGPGEFDFPNHIFIDPSDTMFVTEAKNNRVQVFKETGQYIREYRSSDRLPQPGAVVATNSGYLLVHNESDNKVQILNLDTGRFTKHVLVDLIAPYTRRIAVTRTGFLIALDMSSHCLWRYPIPFD